ncbi:hypothetical protein MLP_38280 [Microlunatus phosphovorus NM-1]|uniref:DUF4386 domain-containing protein n=1 Tax=Microlunatus phosphovorus (strain ATCC 700054 / DSM 10555 / JCM 9379 / NBRC 101784 / NCIMB 13414 / VKM Ac-1990 / NM-1) TaxID=1032480 RepID=F5XQ11_MICPN|nr:DUF4386 family protein [Microlunatus phosphovorus]BAK36842.1 hypothetical protein MLP_38280 [Microlunatus phosphovorus NM-1]
MSTVSIRTASLLAGVSLALMAVLAPLGLMIALPAGAVGVAATVVLLIAVLDVFVAVGLYPVLLPAGALLAACASGLRLAYAAVFATAAGSLAGPSDVERFEAVWEMGLFVFAGHLLLVGIAGVRADGIPRWVGVLVLAAGLGYLADSVSIAIAPATPLAIGEFAFVGEVVLLVWLLGWSGRATSRRKAVADRHGS